MTSLVHASLFGSYPPPLPSPSPSQAVTYIQSMQTYPRKDFTEFFQGANPLAVDVLDKMLAIDPDKRITAAEALSHPYFATYADPDDEVGVACFRGVWSV